MSMTDPIADMLTRIRNGIQARHERVEMPLSKLKLELARILMEQGFISNYKKIETGPQGVLRVYLKYTPEGDSAIHKIERVSRPGRRVYRNKTTIPKPLGGLGVAIMSTSRGILAGEDAIRDGVGGEVLCQVW